MKRIIYLIIILMTLFHSCSRNWSETEGEGSLRIYFSENSYVQTKATAEIPDTGAFLLKVTDSGGKVIYDGTFGDSPEKLLVSPGTYNICVRSGLFSKPAFSSPLFGDDQCVVVKSGAVSDVYLTCEQINSGMKLRISPDFLTSYSNAVLFLKSAEGKLMYSYSEKRVAYFNPGNVSLILSENGKEKNLCTKTLKPKQVLVMSISAPVANSSETGRIHVAVDTSRDWTNDRYSIGGSSGSGNSGGTGFSKDKALNVSQAKSELGAEDVWVYGYIVGGDLTSASMSFEEPFKSNANIAIASRASVVEKESCMSVQLLKGSIRDALNLVDNPELIGHKVYLKGDIVESYYSIPGVKNISDYVIE